MWLQFYIPLNVHLHLEYFFSFQWHAFSFHCSQISVYLVFFVSSIRGSKKALEDNKHWNLQIEFLVSGFTLHQTVPFSECRRFWRAWWRLLSMEPSWARSLDRRPITPTPLWRRIPCCPCSSTPLIGQPAFTVSPANTNSTQVQLRVHSQY